MSRDQPGIVVSPSTPEMIVAAVLGVVFWLGGILSDQWTWPFAMSVTIWALVELESRRRPRRRPHE